MTAKGEVCVCEGGGAVRGGRWEETQCGVSAQLPVSEEKPQSHPSGIPDWQK